MLKTAIILLPKEILVKGLDLSPRFQNAATLQGKIFNFTQTGKHRKK